MDKNARERIIVDLQQREQTYYALTDLKNSMGWEVVEKLAREEVEFLDNTIRKSDSPDIVFSCTKKKYGILFLIEEVNNLLKEGAEAINKLRAQQ
jgi:hypothetical protein